MSEELAVIEHEDAQHGGVLAIRDPEQMIAQATAIANQLKAVVSNAGLITKIGGKDYMNVEAWTTLGVLVGCTARTEWTKEVRDDAGNHVGWEAAVDVVNSHGLVIGRAEAECLRSEKNWKGRDDYALKSMAQTRAMGKALRMPLGWIAVLAGYEATPSEEMPRDEPAGTISEPQRRRLFAKARNANVSDARVAELVKEIAGVDATADIPRDRYDALIEAVELDRLPFGETDG